MERTRKKYIHKIKDLPMVLWCIIVRILLLSGLIYGYFNFRENVYFEIYTIIIIVYFSIYTFLAFGFFLTTLHDTDTVFKTKEDLEKLKKKQELLLEKPPYVKILLAISKVLFLIFIIFTGIIGYWGLFSLTILICILRFLINKADLFILKDINDSLAILYVKERILSASGGNMITKEELLGLLLDEGVPKEYHALLMGLREENAGEKNI